MIGCILGNSSDSDMAIRKALIKEPGNCRGARAAAYFGLDLVNSTANRFAKLPPFRCLTAILAADVKGPVNDHCGR
jgi:hypothetical protein